MTGSSEKLVLESLQQLQWRLCEYMRAEILNRSADELSAVVKEGDDDTIYSIDLETEKFILEYFEREIAPEFSCVLIAEGIEDGDADFTPGPRSDAEFTIIMDPLDGTRGLMYGKRSAWVLAGAAHGWGADLTLRDIAVAVQTEISPLKQTVAEQLWAVAGLGAHGERRDLTGGSKTQFIPKPSHATDLQYGFVTFSRFFPGTKDIITEIEIELNKRLAADAEKHFYFEDQYICSGGQLVELATGHDRFVCDLRAVLSSIIVERGGEAPLCVHPYDVCAELIAREAGVIVTDARGEQLAAPLDTTTDVAWIGYANERIRAIIEPHILNILSTHYKIR